MRASKTVLILSAGLLYSLAVPKTATAWQNRESNSIILESGKLKINGTSNVNDFECVYDEEIEEDETKHYVDVQEATYEISGDELILEVDSFDCGKKVINRDFRKTLKSDKYPNINVELVKVFRVDGAPSQADVAITIAEVTNTYRVTLHDVSIEEESAVIGGTQIVKMTDFALTPPTALFGLIKVNDELEINFTLRIKQ
ncbi:MAG TPA: hypothetical protein DEQ34_09925 [Balneolaceae bacterium]|nr:hypothetical protein [Balneolaceae bacterium]|tara:strand:- start:23368 stop:23967 length:600 start_codon:yes stop_codon:yes gene_type:complete